MAPSSTHDHWWIRPLDSGAVTLAQFKGKVVFLNFWSTSCGPCIAEMPSIEKLRDSLKDEPVVFLAVTPEDEQAVSFFIVDHPLHIPVFRYDYRDVPQDLAPEGFPTTFILDRAGRAVYRNEGAVNWDDGNARNFIRSLEKQ